MELLIAGIGALLLGLVAGYFAGTRPVAGLRAEVAGLRDNFAAAIRDLASAEERARAADTLRADLAEAMTSRAAAEREAAAQRPVAARVPDLERSVREAGAALAEAERAAASLGAQAARLPALEDQLIRIRDERDRLAEAKAAYDRGEQERASAHEAQLAQLRDLHGRVEAQFGELAAKALTDAQGRFLERANARFAEAGNENEAKLKLLLQPVEETLKRYETNLAQVERDRVGSYGELRQQIEQVRTGQNQVREEAAKLVNALRSSPKARGRWGEQSLKNVLEQAGLSTYADYAAEVSVTTEDGRLRPDVVVRLPGGRKLIIDAKCSLNAFLDATEAVDETMRVAHLKAHAGSIRTHAQQLGSKAYWQQFGDAADYVVMYIPGEHFLTAALEQDDGLWDWAYERRVLLATPTNLVAIARTVATVWRQEKLAEEAAEIARLGKELHARLATMGGHVAKLGRNLELATGAYNNMVGSLESQVLTQARRFEALEVSHGGKAIDDLPVVEGHPRALTKLDATMPDDRGEGAGSAG